ncbi:hypothetical protein V6N13_042811 [Hibiscus sabdariffa]
MATSSSSSAEGLLSRFDNAAVKERYYNIVAAKNRWEEQGFLFDDGLENYGLEPIIYKRRVPANSAIINNLLDLSGNEPSIYELIGDLEDIDYNTIKDQLCMPGTDWNITGKNPGTISRPCLLPEAKLWNTFVKRNLMPTSHNQTVDRTRLVLINAIITGYKFNVGEVIAKELSEACQNDKGILAFHCIISALYRRAAVPTRPNDKYTPLWSGWTRRDYMRKMDLTDVVPIQMAMPTPPTSEHQPSDLADTQAATPAKTHQTPPASHQESPAVTPETQASFATIPATPPTATEPQTSPAQTTETTPSIQLLQLRNQLQRMEARQLQFIEEMISAYLPYVFRMIFPTIAALKLIFKA